MSGPVRIQTQNFQCVISASQRELSAEGENGTYAQNEAEMRMLGRNVLQWEELGYRHALCDYLGRFGTYNVYNTDFFENMKLQV